MSEAETGGLSCKLNLPLKWYSLAESDAVHAQTAEQNNLSRLHTILGLDDSARELHEDDSGVAAELQRLDFKINTVLELVAQLVVARGALPDPVAVTLTPALLSFDLSRDLPAPGERVVVELFLDPRFPFPLILRGWVASVVAADLPDYSVRVVFDTLSESLREMLEKYIFRCHRRHIARRKKNSG